MIPVETLHDLLRLDPETGRLHWRERGPEWFTGSGNTTAAQKAKGFNARFAGREAFTADNGKGYRQGRLLGRAYKRSHVVFAMHNGRWPACEVDHRDTARSNDKPRNLREATRSEQCWNASGRGGTSRFCGVAWYPKTSKWRMQCRASGRRHTGYFDTEVAAAAAYDAIAKVHHGAFARLNFPELGATA